LMETLQYSPLSIRALVAGMSMTPLPEQFLVSRHTQSKQVVVVVVVVMLVIVVLVVVGVVVCVVVV